MVLDLLAHNDWERPIYFAVTTGPDSYINLQDHFQLEGLTYRLVPVKSESSNPNTQGRVAADIMYENVTTKFLWGNMDSQEPVYLDENILRMTTNLRLQLSSLAEELIAQGKDDKALTILDLSLNKMPEHNVPYDRILLPTVEAYYAIGEIEKGNDCLLYTSDAADERSSVDLGGRRIIKKKNKNKKKKKVNNQDEKKTKKRKYIE